MAVLEIWPAVLLALTGWLLSTGPVVPQTIPTPSFDCARADHYVEWGICHDADLARLDAAIGNRLDFLLANLDPVAAEALRADQARFLADRDSFIGGTLKGEWIDALKDDILAKLEDRLATLEAIAPNPPAEFSGHWISFSGSLIIGPDERGGNSVGIEGRNDNCWLWAMVVSEGNDLVAANGNSSHAQSVSRRVGDALEIVVTPDVADMVHCGALSGTYFYTGQTLPHLSGLQIMPPATPRPVPPPVRASLR
jgi:hypothetical protein